MFAAVHRVPAPKTHLRTTESTVLPSPCLSFYIRDANHHDHLAGLLCLFQRMKWKCSSPLPSFGHSSCVPVYSCLHSLGMNEPCPWPPDQAMQCLNPERLRSRYSNELDFEVAMLGCVPGPLENILKCISHDSFFFFLQICCKGGWNHFLPNTIWGALAVSHAQTQDARLHVLHTWTLPCPLHIYMHILLFMFILCIRLHTHF